MLLHIKKRPTQAQFIIMDYVAHVGLRVSMFSHSDILLKVSAVI